MGCIQKKYHMKRRTGRFKFLPLLYNILEAQCIKLVHRWGPYVWLVIGACWLRGGTGHRRLALGPPRKGGPEGTDTGPRCHHRRHSTPQFPTPPHPPSLAAVPPLRWAGGGPIRA